MATTLKKKDVINGLKAMTSLTDAQAKEVYSAFPKLIEKALANGANVRITGFGTFEARKREAHTAINPGTREEVQVPAKIVPGFRSSNKLKQALREASAGVSENQSASA